MTSVNSMYDMVALLRLYIHEPWRAKYIHLYLTMWCCTLVILSATILQSIPRYINVLFLTTFVFAVATYIVNINPGHLNVIIGPNNENVKLQGAPLHIFDFCVHFLPFLYCYFNYSEFYKQQPFGYATSNALIIIFVYLWCINPIELYDLRTRNSNSMEEGLGLGVAALIGALVYVGIVL